MKTLPALCLAALSLWTAPAAAQVVISEVNFTPQSGRERKIEIVKEIVPSPPSFHPGLKRQVKTQMSVSDEQDTKRGLAH